MKDHLQEILDSLDEKTPRSRLAPYHKLIIELRRRKYTYREILRILQEKCQIQVSISTLHNFIRAQKKPQRVISKTAGSGRPKPQAERTPKRIPIPPFTPKSFTPVRTPDEIRRIAALKQRTAQPPEPDTKRFEYDPGQPLHLVPDDEKI